MPTRLAPASCRPWETRPSQRRREKNCRHTIWRVTRIRWINRALRRSSIRDRLRSPLPPLKQRRNRRPLKRPQSLPQHPSPLQHPRPLQHLLPTRWQCFALRRHLQHRLPGKRTTPAPLHGRQRHRHDPLRPRPIVASKYQNEWPGTFPSAASHPSTPSAHHSAATRRVYMMQSEPAGTGFVTKIATVLILGR